MVAERIYLDFDEGGFTAQREQREANIKQSYSQNYPLTHKDDAGNVIYSNPFSCRFSAFAISKIYMDRMRLRHAASYELAQLVLTELTQGGGAPDGAAYLAQRRTELETIGVRLDALTPNLTERVFARGSGPGRLPERSRPCSTICARPRSRRDCETTRRSAPRFVAIARASWSAAGTGSRHCWQTVRIRSAATRCWS